VDVIVWNMQHNETNWALLRPGNELAADIHLLCEARSPPRDISAIGQWRTVGLADALPLDRPVTREWSTVVAATSGPTFITDARRAREYKDRPLLPFKPSRPGTWTAARVKVGRLTVTAIALYGLLDEMSDASVHRSLSEISPIFDHRVYGRHLLLGGDFNIFANPRPHDRARERHLSVLTRLEAYGLVNCLDGFKRPLKDAREDRVRAAWRAVGGIGERSGSHCRPPVPPIKKTSCSRRGRWPRSRVSAVCSSSSPRAITRPFGRCSRSS